MTATASLIEMPRPSVEVLSGGDRRSIGEVARVIGVIGRAPTRLPELVDALDGPDAVVVLRAADALEKLGRMQPGALLPYRARLLRVARATTDPAVRWNLVQLLPALTRSGRAMWRLAEELVRWCRDDPSIVVRANALEALVQLAQKDVALQRIVNEVLRGALDTASPAVRARARRLCTGLPSGPEAG